MSPSLKTLALALAFAARALSLAITPTDGVTEGSTGSSALEAAVSTAVSASDPNMRTRLCNVQSEHASNDFLRTAELLHMSDASNNSVSNHLGRRSTITVNTYFHIIADQWSVNMVTADMIINQVNTLNSEYQPAGIQFNLVEASFTQNDAWAVGAGNDMQAAKNALRKGTYADLNVYYHTNLTGGMLGTCTLPTKIPGPYTDKSVYVVDGCNVAAGSMPNGNIYGYNLGKTTVHEVGHWFGLLHTFEGYSCDGPGDYISDTKQESASTDGCPTSPAKNSCPNIGASADPIHNYMDYSSDACYTGFTALQEQRMQSMWSLYRVDN